MNLRCILGISAMTVFGLALVAGSAVGQEKSLRDQLVGSWILVSTETMTQSGKRTPMVRTPGASLSSMPSGDTRSCKAELIAPN